MKTLLVLTLLSLNAFGSLNKAKFVFDKLFYSEQINYRLCGENTKLFLKYLHKAQIDLDEVSVFLIANKGTHFGSMVKAFNARWGDFVQSSRPGYSVKMSGWYDHVVAHYRGYVFDFSYGEKPTVVKTSHYIRKMFLVEHPVPTFSRYQIYDYQKTLEAIKSYQVKIIKVDEFVKNNRRSKGFITTSLFTLYQRSNNP